MASRIAISKEAPLPSRKTARVEQPDYLKWIRSLPCVITGTRPVEAAHVSFANPAYGAHGRGKGSKVSDRWALPLSPAAHRAQHGAGEQSFWFEHGINPHVLCMSLWGLFCERGPDTVQEAERIIALARGGRFRLWPAGKGDTD